MRLKLTLHPIKATSLIDTKHGFFTRKGGVSTGEFAELNCGYGSPENHNIVAENRCLIASHFGLQRDQLFSVKQTHSANVITIDDAAQFPHGIEADAMVTSLPKVGLAVLTADCAPVLFCDQANGVIGAAHAGWRGAFGGVLESTVAAMCKLGAKRGSIVAAIGPCISQKNYEVGQEFFEEFLSESTDNSQFFTNAAQGKYLFDLPRFALSQLRKSGIRSAEWTGQCTYADPATFYSYRYSQHNSLPSYGRLLSVITI